MCCIHIYTAIRMFKVSLNTIIGVYILLILSIILVLVISNHNSTIFSINTNDEILITANIITTCFSKYPITPGIVRGFKMDYQIHVTDHKYAQSKILKNIII